MTGEDYPHPDDTAEELDTPEYGLGVRRDELIEAAIDAGSAKHNLQRMYVSLDAICDDKGLLPDEVYRDMRDIQQDIEVLMAWFKEFEEGLRDVKDQMGESCECCGENPATVSQGVVDVNGKAFIGALCEKCDSTGEEDRLRDVLGPASVEELKRREIL